MSDWRIEFSNYPADSMPEIPAGFEDRSWRNDACPAFGNLTTRLEIWVDWPAAEDRAFEGAPRFSVNRLMSNDSGGDAPFLQTDSWERVLEVTARGEPSPYSATDDDVKHAALLSDVDAAALYLQEFMGTTDGGLASVMLPGHSAWAAMDVHSRSVLLTAYVKAERRDYADGLRSRKSCWEFASEGIPVLQPPAGSSAEVLRDRVAVVEANRLLLSEAELLGAAVALGGTMSVSATEDSLRISFSDGSSLSRWRAQSPLTCAERFNGKYAEAVGRDSLDPFGDETVFRALAEDVDDGAVVEYSKAMRRLTIKFSDGTVASFDSPDGTAARQLPRPKLVRDAIEVVRSAYAEGVVAVSNEFEQLRVGTVDRIAERLDTALRGHGLYTHETCMCVWEEVLRRATSPDYPGMQNLISDVGTASLRLNCVDAARFVDAVYEALSPDKRDAEAFDWDLVPVILDFVEWGADGEPNFARSDVGVRVVARMVEAKLAR